MALIPERPAATPAALEAIGEADLILLGPGSLYTSVIPNLLVEGVAHAIAQSDAPKIYVCNIMTQDGETEGYTAADHLEALMAHGEPGLVDLCLANSAAVPQSLVEKYSQEDAAPLYVDRDRIAAMGLELVERPVAWEEATLPATTRTSWPRPCWKFTAAVRCVSSTERGATFWRSDHVLCRRRKK